MVNNSTNINKTNIQPSHKKGHDVRCTISTRPTRLVGYFMVLLHWNNSPQGDMSLHSDTLYCMNPSQKVFVLSPLCCVLNGETLNTNFMVFGLTRPQLEPMIYALEPSMLTITAPTRLKHTYQLISTATKNKYVLFWIWFCFIDELLDHNTCMWFLW